MGMKRQNEYGTHLGSIRVLEASVLGNSTPVNLGLALHVLDDGVEEECLLSSGLLAAIGAFGGSCFGGLGRHFVVDVVLLAAEICAAKAV